MFPRYCRYSASELSSTEITVTPVVRRPTVNVIVRVTGRVIPIAFFTPESVLRFTITSTGNHHHRIVLKNRVGSKKFLHRLTRVHPVKHPQRMTGEIIWSGSVRHLCRTCKHSRVGFFPSIGKPITVTFRGRCDSVQNFATSEMFVNAPLRVSKICEIERYIFTRIHIFSARHVKDL